MKEREIRENSFRIKSLLTSFTFLLNSSISPPKAVRLLFESHTGKDVLSLSLPMCLCDPSSHLQLMCESLKYWNILQSGGSSLSHTHTKQSFSISTSRYLISLLFPLPSSPTSPSPL